MSESNMEPLTTTSSSSSISSAPIKTIEIEADDQDMLDAESSDDGRDENGEYPNEYPASTASAKSSIFRFREENGRTYHAYKAGKYILPNDEQEQNRLDLQSHLLYLTLDRRLTLAPLENVKRTLDIGTGTGIWAINFADEHPEIEIVAMDLSPIQPIFVPTNLIFEIDDLEESWTFSQKFDYIHSSLMCGSFRDWPKFYKQSFDNLASGGYLEIQDLCFVLSCDDDTLSPTSALSRWSTLMIEAANNLGFSLDYSLRAKKEMKEAGFVDIVQVNYKWPQNKWPKDKKYKELGMWTKENFTMDGNLEGLTMALLTRGLGWTREEVIVLCAHAKKDMNNTGIHAYYPVHVVYGRKP